ncbi:MAG: hypothetical protein U0T85_04625 [Cloacibacterium normanense]
MRISVSKILKESAQSAKSARDKPMKKFFKIFIVPIFLTVTSCQINQVLEPWRNSLDKEFAWKEGIDSLKLKISGENLQPTFYKNNETLERNYAIKSYYFKTKEGRKLNAWLFTIYYRKIQKHQFSHFTETQGI